MMLPKTCIRMAARSRVARFAFARLVGRLALLWMCGLLVSSDAARAGFSVEISVNGGVPAFYPDGGLLDMDMDPFEIAIAFNVSDVDNNWRASGTVFATGGNGYPPVSTIVTGTLIEKLLPGLFFGQIQVVHNYAASGLASHSAVLDGQFENVLGNPISYAELFYTPKVTGDGVFGMGIAHEGPVINVIGPVPFDDNLGPLLLTTTTQHEITIGFYLDAPGDAIRLFNSAELHTVVPEPGTATLAWVALGMGSLLARHSSVPRARRLARAAR